MAAEGAPDPDVELSPGPNASRREALDSFASGLAVQLLLVITGVIAARLLGPDGRGQQSLIWVVVLTTLQLVTLGVPLAATYEVARGRISAVALHRHLRPLVLAQVVLILLVYAVVALGVMADRLPLAPALVSTLAIPAMVSQIYSLALVQGAHRFRALHVLRVLPVLLYALGLAAGAALGAHDLMLVMSAWVGAYVTGAIVTFGYVLRLGASDLPRPEEELPSIAGMARFGATGFLGSSSPTETFRVDQLVVAAVLSTVDLGLYTTALAFCNLPRFLAQALGLVAYPRIAREGERREQRRLLLRFTAVGTAVAALVALPLLLFAEPLIHLVFGAEFEGVGGTTRILLAATVVLCARRMLSECMRGAGHPGAGSVAEAISIVSLLPACLLLVPSLGLEGFAWAMVVSYSVSLAFLLVFVERRGLGLGRAGGARSGSEGE